MHLKQSVSRPVLHLNILGWLAQVAALKTRRAYVLLEGPIKVASPILRNCSPSRSRYGLKCIVKKIGRMVDMFNTRLEYNYKH